MACSRVNFITISLVFMIMYASYGYRLIFENLFSLTALHYAVRKWFSTFLSKTL